MSYTLNSIVWPCKSFSSFPWKGYRLKIAVSKCLFCPLHSGSMVPILRNAQILWYPVLLEHCCVHLRWNMTNASREYRIVTPNFSWTKVPTFLIDVSMPVDKPDFDSSVFQIRFSFVLLPDLFQKGRNEKSCLIWMSVTPFWNSVLYFLTTSLSFVHHFTTVTNFFEADLLCPSKQNACTKIWWRVSMSSALNIILFHN